MLVRSLPFLQSEAGGASGAATSDANAGGQTGGTGSQQQPFATFPDAASFAERVSREATGQLKAQATEHGYESVEELLAAAKTAREKADADKSELQKATDGLTKAQAAIASANQRAIAAEAKAVAASAGVPADRLAYVIRLVDLSEAVTKDGAPDEAKIKSAIEQVLKDIPELAAAGDGTARRSSGDFNGSGSQNAQAGDMNQIIRRAARRT